MELFYSPAISEGNLTLGSEESNHCIRVLRHREGDTIHIIDGSGSLYECEISDANPKCLGFRITGITENYGAHPYRLNMAVAPPKNIDRFEWFAEKGTEIGLDEITPLFGEFSERKVFKPERVERILVSAAKQSHKGAVPTLNAAVGVKEFIERTKDAEALKMICWCGEAESVGAVKTPVTELLDAYNGNNIIIMIGPEGDFSASEVEQAVAAGWKITSLGGSRLRIETAALTAVAAVYLKNIR